MSPRLPLLCGLLYCFSGAHVAFAAPDSSVSENVAVVDGVPVTRALFDRTLEGFYGQQILPQLIDNQLLTNALAGRGLSVSDEEVEREFARIERQDPTVRTTFEARGVRIDVIKNQVRRNLTLQKLLTSRIAAPTDAQLRAFFTTYSAYYGTPLQNKLGLLLTSTKERADQLERALKAKPASFEALVNEQKSNAATDAIAGQSVSDVGRFETPDEFGTSRGIPPQVAAPFVQALSTSKKGRVLPMQALTPTGPFLIVKVIDRKEATKPDFGKQRWEIEIDYKLAQLAQTELKKKPQNPQTLAEAFTAVSEVLSQPNPKTGVVGAKPSLRDMLTFILQPASDNSMQYLRSHAKVTITDPSFASVASEYKTTP